MPTNVTGVVAEILHLNSARKNCLQQFQLSDGMVWEYVPTLEHIKRNPGCMQADISKKFKVSAAAVTQSTQKLENAGFITKQIDPNSLRTKRMYITEKGIEALKFGSAVFDKVDQIMFNEFSDIEIETLEKLLKRANDNMSKYRNNPAWELKSEKTEGERK